MPLGGYQSPSGRTAGLLVSGSRLKPLWRRPERDALAVRAVEHHERVGLRLVRLVLLDVGDADDLVLAVAVEVADRRRRGRPLQPRRLVHVRPVAGVPVVVVVLDLGLEPADELAPAEPLPDEAALAVRVPRRREHRRAVVVEEVDLVVVVGDDDLALRVVVELADPDVLPVGAVALVADAVERRVRRAVPRPAGRVRAGGGEDEDLRAAGGGVGRRGHDLDATVAVEVGRRQAAGLRALAAAAGRGRPAGLEVQPAGAEVVGRDGPVVAADDDLLHAVAGRGRRPRRARRPALCSRCPCPGAGPSRRRRTCCRRARRSRASCRR